MFKNEKREADLGHILKEENNLYFITVTTNFKQEHITGTSKESPHGTSGESPHDNARQAVTAARTTWLSHEMLVLVPRKPQENLHCSSPGS